MLLSNEYTLIPHIKITLKYDDGIVQHHILKEDDIIICKYRENTKISTINGKITKIGYKLNSSFAVINRTIYLQIDGSDKHAGHVVYVNIDDIVGIKVLKTGSMISNPVCTVANEDQAVCMLRENENGQLEYSKDGLEWKTVGAVLPNKPEHKEEEKPVVDEHSTTGGETNEKREENTERENSGKDTTVESNSGNVSENNQGHAVSPVVEKEDKVVDAEAKPPVEERHEENTSAHVDESHNTVEEKHEETHTESSSVTTEDHHDETSLQPQPSTDDHSVNTEDTSSHNTVEEKHEDTPTNVAGSEEGKHEETTHTTGETTHTESPSVTTEDHHDETGLQPPTGDTTHTETNSVVNSETHESETHTESSPVAAEVTHTTAETHDESGLHNEEGLIKPPENHTEENTHHEEANRVIDNGIHEEQPVAAVPQPVIDNGIHTEPVVANPVSNDHNSETTTPIATEGVTESSFEDGAARTNYMHVEPMEDSQ
jgi:variable membrane protein, putative